MLTSILSSSKKKATSLAGRAKKNSKSSDNLDCVGPSVGGAKTAPVSEASRVSWSSDAVDNATKTKPLSLAKMASLHEGKTVGNGVTGYKEFISSKHHEMILGTNAIRSNNCSRNNSDNCNRDDNSQLTASNSKLNNNGSSINAVLKKAVVATKSWAGDGSSHKYSSVSSNRVASTRSFSSGLCSLMAEGGGMMGSNIDGSPRPFMFDPIVSPDQQGTPHHNRNGSHDTYHSLVSSAGGYSSGAASLDGVQQLYSSATSRGGAMRSLTSLSDARHSSLVAMEKRGSSASQHALCDQCFVTNIQHNHQELHLNNLHHHHQQQQRNKHYHHQQQQQQQLLKYHRYQERQLRCRCGCEEQTCGSPAAYGGGGSSSCCSGDPQHQHRMSWHERSHCDTICRCSSDIRLPDHYRNRRDVCSPSSKACSACYLGYKYGGASYTSLQTSSSSCIHKYDDYVDYTQSPYATHSPYRDQSPYRSQSPYTSHYDTPPLSYHSPPVASSPSHSYYSPSESYTTPTENLQAGISSGGGVYTTLHSLNNIPSMESSISGNLHTASLLNGSGGIACLCDDSSYANNCGGNGTSEDICQDPCKEMCGGQVCCTSIGRCNTNAASSTNKFKKRYKHYITAHLPELHHSSKARQECHPNWKSTESHKEENHALNNKVSSSRSEGLLCTEL